MLGTTAHLLCRAEPCFSSIVLGWMAVGSIVLGCMPVGSIVLGWMPVGSIVLGWMPESHGEIHGP